MRHLVPFRRFATLVAAAALLTGAAVAVPTGASAFSSANGVRLNAVEARLTALINQARTSRGIPALTVVPGTTDMARDWAMNQASKNLLYHNPNLVTGVQTHGSAYWHVVAENVGRGWGGGADALFTAYMNSPGHRANILDADMRYLGIGWVERPDGSGYNTQVFVDQYSTSYGRNRRPAVGGLSDVRTPTANFSLGTFEGGWDPRVLLVHAGAGLGVSGPVYDKPTTGDDGVRFSVRETALTTTAYSELRLRDALDLRNATGVRVRLSATTGSGRPVTVQVNARRELGSGVTLGNVSVPPGQVVTVTLPVPSGARNFRNALGFAVTATSLNALSGSVSLRYATVRVRDVTVLV